MSACNEHLINCAAFRPAKLYAMCIISPAECPEGERQHKHARVVARQRPSHPHGWLSALKSYVPSAGVCFYVHTLRMDGLSTPAASFCCLVICSAETRPNRPSHRVSRNGAQQRCTREHAYPVGGQHQADRRREGLTGGVRAAGERQIDGTHHSSNNAFVIQ